MRQAGLDFSPSQVGDVRFSDIAGNAVDCACDFLGAHKGLDAVVCYGLKDVIAIRTAAAQMGIRVPDDLDLIVFNEREAHAQVGWPTHTMIIPFKQVGARAADMVLDLIDQGDGAGPAAVPYEHLFDTVTGQIKALRPGA